MFGTLGLVWGVESLGSRVLLGSCSGSGALEGKASEDEDWETILRSARSDRSLENHSASAC